MGISLLVLAFAGLFLVGLVVLIGVLLAGRRDTKASAQYGKVCGQCQYPVRDLPSFTCPECGSDLREVGIVALVPQPRRKALTIIIAILAAMLIGGILLSTVGYLAARNAQQRAVQTKRQALQAAKSTANTNSSPSTADASDWRSTPSGD